MHARGAVPGTLRAAGRNRERPGVHGGRRRRDVAGDHDPPGRPGWLGHGGGDERVPRRRAARAVPLPCGRREAPRAARVRRCPRRRQAREAGDAPLAGGRESVRGDGLSAKRRERLLTNAMTARRSASVRWSWGTIPVEGTPRVMVRARSASVGTWPEAVERNLKRPLVRSRGTLLKWCVAMPWPSPVGP